MIEIDEERYEEMQNVAAVAFCMLEFAERKLAEGDSLGDRWSANHPAPRAMKFAALKLFDEVNNLSAK